MTNKEWRINKKHLLYNVFCFENTIINYIKNIKNKNIHITFPSSVTMQELEIIESFNDNQLGLIYTKVVKGEMILSIHSSYIDYISKYKPDLCVSRDIAKWNTPEDLIV